MVGAISSQRRLNIKYTRIYVFDLIRVLSNFTVPTAQLIWDKYSLLVWRLIQFDSANPDTRVERFNKPQEPMKDTLGRFFLVLWFAALSDIS
jgi:hypothetical protein